MTLHPDEIDTKTIGLKWTADFDEFDRATENGIELVHHGYSQDMMAGKILKVQVHSFFDDSMWPEEKNLDPASRRSWKVLAIRSELVWVLPKLHAFTKMLGELRWHFV